MNWFKKLRPWTRDDAGRHVATLRRKPTLGVERLDERLVPSGLPQEVQPVVVFSVLNSGTWAHERLTGEWRRITAAKASVMDEGANGTFYGVYSNGTYRYEYGTNTWTKLTSAKATVLDAAHDNTLFGTFGNGTWEYDGSWDKISTAKATDIAAVSNNHAYLEFGPGVVNSDDGIWEWNGGTNWLHRSPHQAAVMDAAADGTLYLSYAHGGTYRMAEGDGQTWLANNIAYAIAAESFHSASFSFYTGTFGWHYTQGYTLYTTTSTTQLHYERDGYGDGYGLVGVFNTGTYLISDFGELGTGGFSLEKLTNSRAKLL